MDRSMKVKLAAGAAAGAIVALAIALGAVGALATAQVLSSDDDRAEGDRFEYRMPPAFDDPSDRGLFGGPPLRYPGRGVDLDEAATYLDLSESEVRDRVRGRRHAGGHRPRRGQVRRRPRPGARRRGERADRRGGGGGEGGARRPADRPRERRVRASRLRARLRVLLHASPALADHHSNEAGITRLGGVPRTRD